MELLASARLGWERCDKGYVWLESYSVQITVDLFKTTAIASASFEKRISEKLSALRR